MKWFAAAKDPRFLISDMAFARAMVVFSAFILIWPSSLSKFLLDSFPCTRSVSWKIVEFIPICSSVFSDKISLENHSLFFADVNDNDRSNFDRPYGLGYVLVIDILGDLT